jgi:hypothetical protein
MPSEERAAHQRAMARLRAMAPEEISQSAVAAGIYTPDGQLTGPYRRGAAAEQTTHGQPPGEEIAIGLGIFLASR